MVHIAHSFHGLSNLIAFNGLIVLFLVPSMLKNPNDFKKASMISVIVAAILFILATASLLLAFSFSTQIDQISSLYILLSNNDFGRYFQHPESLFVFTWILSFMTYLNIICMLLVNILQKITNVRNGKPFVIPLCFLIFIIAMLPDNIMHVRYISSFVSHYISIPVVFLILPIILIIGNIKHKKMKTKNSNVLSE